MNINQETFEAWLFSQPDDRQYDYRDNEGCLLCMFAKETSNKRLSVAGRAFRVISDPENTFKYIDFDSWLQRFMCDCVRTNLGYDSVPLSEDFKTVKAIYVAMFGQPMMEIPMPELIEQPKQLTITL